MAAWARALTPDGRLTDTQRELLAPDRDPVSAAQRRAEALSSYQASPLWGHLGPKERQKVKNATFPMGIGALSKLVGMSESRLRYWEEKGLLPARRTLGGHRQFFAMAAVRAFVLKRLQQRELTVLRNVYERKAGALLAGMAMVLNEQPSGSAPPEKNLFGTTADYLEKVSLVMGSGKLRTK